MRPPCPHRDRLPPPLPAQLRDPRHWHAGAGAPRGAAPPASVGPLRPLLRLARAGHLGRRRQMAAHGNGGAPCAARPGNAARSIWRWQCRPPTVGWPQRSTVGRPGARGAVGGESAAKEIVGNLLSLKTQLAVTVLSWRHARVRFRSQGRGCAAMARPSAAGPGPVGPLESTAPPPLGPAGRRRSGPITFALAEVGAESENRAPPAGAQQDRDGGPGDGAPCKDMARCWPLRALPARCRQGRRRRFI